MEASVGVKGASQIKVISQDNEVKFIKVSLKQVFQAGTAQEHEENSDASSSAGLIITPLKIALSPSSQRIVRLVSVVPPKKETTWRAYFENVNEDNFITQADDLKSPAAKASVGVNVVWGVLIHVAPETIKPSLTFTEGSSKVFNNGSIRIPIKEVGECESNNQCKWTKIDKIVYPDAEFNLAGITFSRGKMYRVKYINWITEKTEELSLSQ